MRLIKPSFEIIEQEPGLEGIYKAIELAGRNCYKSESNIKEGSAKEFVDRMVKSKHLAMCEHGTVYLKNENTDSNELSKYINNKYSIYKNKYIGKKIFQSDIDYYSEYITTNYRCLVENNWLDDLQYLCDPTEFHEKRIMVRFICDRGVSHEFVRNRGAFGNAFAQESTRYCNYSKNKFGNELTFIIPCWMDVNKFPKHTIISHDDYGDLISEYYFHLNGKETSYFKPYKITPEANFITALQISEQLYLELLLQGQTPQQARAILPNALKTELIMTGYISDWKHFFELRDSKAAHPQAYELAHPLHEEFIKKGYLN